MNYEEIYRNLMRKGRLNISDVEIYEKHHILPKSLGGSNKKENLVKLTLRQHYVAHKLLVKFLTGRDKWKMYCALKRFIHTKYVKNITSRDYEIIKKNHRIACSNLLKNKFVSDETKRKQSVAQKLRYAETPSHWNGRHHEIETKEKLRVLNLGENNPQYNIPRTDEVKEKISKAMKGKSKSAETVEKFRKRKQSPETKQKIREKITEWHKNKGRTNG